MPGKGADAVPPAVEYFASRLRRLDRKSSEIFPPVRKFHHHLHADLLTTGLILDDGPGLPLALKESCSYASRCPSVLPFQRWPPRNRSRRPVGPTASSSMSSSIAIPIRRS